MRPPIFGRLEARLIFAVGLGLLVFSLFAGIFTYSYSYQKELTRAEASNSHFKIAIKSMC